MIKHLGSRRIDLRITWTGWMINDIYNQQYKYVDAKTEHTAEELPNVLFVLDDQHSARCLGYYGNDTVNTPMLEQLATEGVRFERGYAQSPICLPTRISLFTGQ